MREQPTQRLIAPQCGLTAQGLSQEPEASNKYEAVGGRKVFISYSHDTVEHQERVLGLADRLRADGIDAEIDQYNAAPPEDWPLWCERQIKAADAVLMVCTKTYYRRISGDEEQGQGLGVVWEARIIRQLLYDDSAISDKFIPVLFSDASPEQIPTPIKGWTRYVVDTEEGYEELYRRLTGQPRLLRPALGRIRPLPPRRRQWPEGTMEAAERSERLATHQTEKEYRGARILQKRSEISALRWTELFSTATKRIWLLGHSMIKAVDMNYSGHALAKRLADGVDLRLVVLDPFDGANHQITEISQRIHEPNLRSKISDTLEFAVDVEREAERLINSSNGTCASPWPTFSIGITRAIIHSSIVIIDDKLFVTIYSNNIEMGDTGITLELNKQLSAEETLFDFFKTDFLWHWHRARAFFDKERRLQPVELRVLSHAEHAREVALWRRNDERALPPPHLAVFFPTYRCSYGPKYGNRKQGVTESLGPFQDELLCPNCMYGQRLTSGKKKEMDVGYFKSVCKELIDNNVKVIEIAGGGEPLHHSSRQKFIRAVRDLKDNNENVNTLFGLISNVTALEWLKDYGDERECLTDIIGAFSYVRWSWPENAELNANLTDTHVKNLSRFVALKNKSELNKKTPIRCGVKLLLTRNNCDGQKAPLVEIVEKLMTIVDHIKVRTLRTSYGSAPTEDQIRRAEDAFSRLSFRLHEEGTICDDKTLEVDLVERHVPSTYKCTLSGMVTVIEPNGDVRMCWNDSKPDPTRVIGNAFERTFFGVWGSARHRQICASMRPRLVCNADMGCHCRIVGYQEIAEHMVLADLALPVGVGRDPHHDQFL